VQHRVLDADEERHEAGEREHRNHEGSADAVVSETAASRTGTGEALITGRSAVDIAIVPFNAGPFPAQRMIDVTGKGYTTINSRNRWWSGQESSMHSSYHSSRQECRAASTIGEK
jgi:hypothetical protein